MASFFIFVTGSLFTLTNPDFAFELYYGEILLSSKKYGLLHWEQVWEQGTTEFRHGIILIWRKLPKQLLYVKL